MYLAAAAGTRSRSATRRPAIRCRRSLDVSGCRTHVLAPLLGDRRRPHRQAHRLRRRHPRHRRARAARGLRPAAVAFSMYPVDRGRPDRDRRRRRHHAAQVHVVRAEAAGRVADARHLKASASGCDPGRPAPVAHRGPRARSRSPESEARSPEPDERPRRGQVRTQRARRPDGGRLRGRSTSPTSRTTRSRRRSRSTGAEVLVVRSTKVTEAMLDAGRLALVVRAGAGYNTIDVAAASRRGIYVSNCPGKNCGRGGGARPSG